MIGGCPHYDGKNHCQRLKQTCNPATRGCVLEGKVRLLKTGKRGENMNSEIKTIDPRGLEHHDREALIFPSIEELGQDDLLRIIMEFNPIPLVYLLEARNEFEISYEKEGPTEWILAVKRIAENKDRKEQLKSMLLEFKSGGSAQTKEKAKQLLQAAEAKDLAIMEQELAREGLPHEEIRRHLCDIHLEVLRDSLVAKQVDVEASHPVHCFMAEHKVIIQNLNRLGTFLQNLKSAESFEDLGRDLETLKDIAHHLVEAESHHQREEEALFARLEAHDIAEPGAIMKMDHEEFRKRKQMLFQLSHNHQQYSFNEFKKQCLEFGEYLTHELENHIFKEDTIIYQIALQTLSKEEWQQIKKECDRIGYCRFTPQD
jgi:hemerythrin-like domain-containing protein/uncharacterized protein (DUF2249 family)